MRSCKLSGVRRSGDHLALIEAVMKRLLVSIVPALLVGASVLLMGNRSQTTAVADPVSFAKAITSPSPVLYPNGLAAGTLNEDGFPDLAVVSFDDSQSMWYGLGMGNGHFDHWSDNVPAAYAPSFVFFSDVDGDGNLDAVTTDFEPSFTVAFGDGKGHFPGYMRPNTGNNCLSVEVVVADLNGDGIPDIVGTCNAATNNSGEVFVLLERVIEDLRRSCTSAAADRTRTGSRWQI